ncbi:MAG: hypothetical protein U9R17_05465 [Thermodesulfobacteriota bacterium]|nr:hypothetical protein [Thermodesulfobacteriota bacterium]
MKKLLVLLAAVAFVVAFTVPAMSADWNFYGSARMSTFFDSDSEEVDNKIAYDDDDLTWALQGNSRLGATVKAGNIGGGFEYGTGVNVRKLYGTWNFGGGELLVGQTYTPLNYFISNQVWGSDNDMLTYGGIYAGRRPMIQLKTGGFKIALIQPNTGAVTNFPAGGETDTSIPKIEASYGFNAGPLKLSLMAMYNTFDVVDAANNEEGVDSYVLGLGFKVPLGAAYVNGNVWMGQNTGNTTLATISFAANPANDAAWDGANIVDNDALGYLLVVGFKASDALSFELGYGQVEHELDQTGEDADETSAMYAQAVINIAKGFFVVPEVGKIDYKEDAAGNDQGDTTYFGAKWQINF